MSNKIDPKNISTLSENSIKEWECGDYGLSSAHAAVDPESSEGSTSVDKATKMKMISIRLDEDLIDSLKGFAEFEGLGYQPLMRIILSRWVEGETKRHVNFFKQQLKQKLSEQEAIDCEKPGDEMSGAA